MTRIHISQHPSRYEHPNYYLMSNTIPALSMIVAAAVDGAIGHGGDMPFRIREDLRHFKRVTIGKPLLMGRRTFESLPGGALPGRLNIVLSRSGFTAPDALTVHSVDDALRAAGAAPEVMVIGGGCIYRDLMPCCTTLYLTQVDASYPHADTRLDLSVLTQPGSKWQLTENGPWQTDPESGLRYCFQTYVNTAPVPPDTKI